MAATAIDTPMTAAPLPPPPSSTDAAASSPPRTSPPDGVVVVAPASAAVVVDDLVAIIIVALFYSGALDAAWSVAAVATAAGLFLLNRSGVYRALPYGLLGLVLWGCLHGAGVHATLAGVVLAVFTPTRPPANLRALLAQAESVLHDRSGVHQRDL